MQLINEYKNLDIPYNIRKLMERIAKTSSVVITQIGADVSVVITREHEQEHADAEEDNGRSYRMYLIRQLRGSLRVRTWKVTEFVETVETVKDMDKLYRVIHNENVKLPFEREKGYRLQQLITSIVGNITHGVDGFIIVRTNGV